MEFVQEAMKERRKDDTNARNESDPAEERVTPGKGLAAAGLNGRERPHARQDHRGVREGIQPGKFLEVMVSSHTYAKCTEYNCQPEDRAPSEPGVKNPAW
jgi:hypothetical protein